MMCSSFSDEFICFNSFAVCVSGTLRCHAKQHFVDSRAGTRIEWKKAGENRENKGKSCINTIINVIIYIYIDNNTSMLVEGSRN